ncbi:spore germination protein GerW family protein [Streptomyces sp. NPDC005181]|uniref:spore germination protein GerW family protein n=1 Tax=Streptomyces sp. NPDC005181 TaxID=3156869 RepID=UPI0033A59B01
MTTQPASPTEEPSAAHASVTLLERLAEKLGSRASVTAVYAEPITRNGITVIPVAKVGFGFGGGAGREVGATKSGEGGGGGGGAEARPRGFIEIRDGTATYRPIPDPWVDVGVPLVALPAGSAAPKIVRASRSPGTGAWPVAAKCRSTACCTARRPLVGGAEAPSSGAPGSIHRQILTVRGGVRDVQRTLQVGHARCPLDPSVRSPVQAAEDRGGNPQHGEGVDAVDEDGRRAVHAEPGSLCLVGDLDHLRAPTVERLVDPLPRQRPVCVGGSRAPSEP